MTEPDKQAHSQFTVLPMKKVLIALDYDPTAQKVAEIGYSLSRTMNAELFILHVVTENSYYSSLDYSPIMGFTGFSNLDPALSINVEEVKRVALEFLEQTRLHLGDDKIKTIVSEGDSADCIIEVAKNIKADLIVMGTVSKRWLEKIIMGSVAQSVLKHTSIPLLVIPTKAHNDKKS